jgi:hypothetical protein
LKPGKHSATFWATGRAFFDPEPAFSLPYGTIAACTEGDHDIGEIAPGFTRRKAANGMTTLEVNVEGNHLLEIYSLLLELTDSFRVFWYLLHDHWEDAGDHFLVNESLDTPEAIIAHLLENEADSILNGYVTLTAYRQEGGTNLSLSDHKRIVISTYSDGVADSYASALNQAGYPEMDELVSIQRGIYHWHYRPSRSRPRAALIEHLHATGFKNWTPGGWQAGFRRPGPRPSMSEKNPNRTPRRNDLSLLGHYRFRQMKMSDTPQVP